MPEFLLHSVWTFQFYHKTHLFHRHKLRNEILAWECLEDFPVFLSKWGPAQMKKQGWKGVRCLRQLNWPRILHILYHHRLKFNARGLSREQQSIMNERRIKSWLNISEQLIKQKMHFNVVYLVVVDPPILENDKLIFHFSCVTNCWRRIDEDI